MNDTPLSVHIATLVVLLLLSGFFSGSETSLMSVNRFRIRHQAKSGNLAAQRVERLLSHPDKLLTMILIGNNLVNIYASSIATIVSMRLFGSYAVAVSTFIMTLVVLIFGEITPKSISAAHAETVAKLVSLPIVWLMWLLKPAVIVMNSISHLIMFILRIDPQKTEEGWLGADELRTALLDKNGTASISRANKDLLLGVLNLEKIYVDELMVPRSEIYAININDTFEEVREQVSASSYDSILLYRDEMDDAVGFIRTVDAMKVLSQKDPEKADLLRLTQEIYYIPENITVMSQLQKFRRRREHIAIVIDEFGDIQGLITLNDIVSEIVGESASDIKSDRDREYRSQGNGCYLINGSANIREINHDLGWELPTDVSVTLNGLILEKICDEPRAGMVTEINGYRIRITRTGKAVIEEAAVCAPEQSPQD